MDFSPELSAFQGAILSADNVHQFSKLTAKGGNEDEIDSVVDSLSTFLERNKYLVNDKLTNTVEARKLALYIVFNADLPELQQLVESNEISSLIWMTPTIPKCLFCELMWKLHMEDFVFEIISFANPQLALEIAAAFLDNFKYLEPLECLKQLQLLSSACYIHLSRLHLFDFETDLENMAKAALNNFLQCLKLYITPPNNHKLNDLRKVELYKYQGYSLHSLLQFIDQSLMQYTGKIEMNPPGYDIYKLTYLEDTLKKDPPIFNIFESPNSVLLEFINQANTAMLDTCQMLIMDVSVDVFCCWSEFEENDKSMQRIVGELCYKVNSRLININILSEHPVVAMLEQISCKPIEMQEKVNATTDTAIIQNINLANDDSKTWIKALIYKENLCESTELLNIVESNLDTYNEEESYKLYTLLKNHKATDSESEEYVELLFIKVFEKCDLSKKYAILEERFCNKTYVDMKKKSEFRNVMTTICNKFIASPNADLTDILTMFLQNPREVLTKIFQLSSENAQQTEIMLKIMKLLENFSDHYYSSETEPCIIQITQTTFDKLETEAKLNNFIKFICGLKDMNIIPTTKLLLLVIMTNLHKALLNEDISRLKVQMKLLREAYDLEELMEYRAPMLAMLAQVMDVARWKINTFTSNSPATLNLAIDIQTLLMDSYNDDIPENQSEWLKSKLSNVKPLNMYYYRVLWEPPGSSYLEVVSGLTITEDVSMDELTSWLSQVICTCTQEEWCDIWDSLKIFDNSMIFNIIHAAVAMITIAEKSNRTDSSWACMLYCYRNFIYITRYKFLVDSITDIHIQSILSKAAMIAELVREENIEEFGTLLMPLFAYLTEKQNNYNVSFIDCINDNLSHTKLSSLIKKVFVNGTA